jgi:hypothetical protein
MPDVSRFHPSARLCIGLSTTGLAIVHREGWWRAKYRVLLDTPPALAPLTAEHLSETLQNGFKQANCGKLPASIILDDAWVRYFMVSPPNNASNIRDCHAAAHRQFKHLYDEAPQAWQINAAWDAQHPFLACALPRPVLKALELAAQSQKISLLRITPHFIACWNKWPVDKGWFGLVHGGQLNLAAIDQGRLKALRQSPFTLAHWQDQDYLPTLMEREALRLGITMPTQLVMHGQLPGNNANETRGKLTCRRIGMAPPPWSNANTGTLSNSLALAALGVQK